MSHQNQKLKLLYFFLIKIIVLFGLFLAFWHKSINFLGSLNDSRYIAITLTDESSIKYSRQFSSYNANVRLSKEKLEFRLSKDWENVTPDIYVLGKSIGGGYPLSAVVAYDRVMHVLTPGDHGSTFGGNSFCSAVAIEAIKVILEENLVENSYIMGKYFLGPFLNKKICLELPQIIS